MKAEMVIENVNYVVCNLGSEDKRIFEEIMARPALAGRVPGIADALACLMLAARDDLRKAAAKANGNAAALKAAEKLIGWVPEHRPDMRGIMESRTGRHIVTDACYMCVRTETALDVEKAKTNEKAETFDRIVDGANENRGAELTVPKASELRAFCREEKAKHKGEKKFKPLWDLGGTLVDAEFLALELDLLGDGARAWASKNNPALCAVYLESETGDGILMPVKPKPRAGE